MNGTLESTMPPADGPGWMAVTSRLVDRFSSAATALGVPPDPALELRTVETPCCPAYVDSDCAVVINLPGGSTIRDRLFWCYYASLLGCPDLASAQRLCADMLPVLVAHEVTHHLRHRYGRHSGDHFEEEQVASIVAVAWVEEQPDLAGVLPRVRAGTRRALQRLRRLAPLPPMYERAEHLSLGEILADEHLISWRQMHRAGRLARLHGETVDQALAGLGLLAPSLARHATEEQAEVRAAFDHEYMADLARYWHFGAAFLSHYLAHRHELGFADAVRTYLQPAG